MQNILLKIIISPGRATSWKRSRLFKPPNHRMQVSLPAISHESNAGAERASAKPGSREIPRQCRRGKAVRPQLYSAVREAWGTVSYAYLFSTVAQIRLQRQKLFIHLIEIMRF